jgi:hypothetical protein
MPYDSESGLYERRTTTVIDASPDGDTVYIAIDAKLDLAADDTVTDLNHHAANGNHYPATSVASDSRFLRQSPSGAVSWANGVVAADAALKDFSNVASGAIAPAKVAQDASNRFFTDAERTKLEGIQALAQVNADITKAEIEAKLTGSISTHTHADASTTAKGMIEIATVAEAIAGTDQSRAVTPEGVAAAVAASTPSGISLGTPVAASNAAVDFINIPAGVKRVTLFVNGVRTTTNSTLCLKIGPSGGLETSGYSGIISYIISTTPASSLDTMDSAWRLEVSTGTKAAALRSGKIVLDLVGTNKWKVTYVGCSAGGMGQVMDIYTGDKTLSGPLSLLQIFTYAGETLDLGTFTISWEF